MGYPKNIVQMIASYLQGRKLRVKICNEVSTNRRQGKNSSTRSRDFPAAVFHIYCGCSGARLSNGSPNIDFIGKQYSHCQSKLVTRLCNKEAADEPHKTEALLIQGKRRYCSEKNIPVNGQRILWKKKAMYLGVFIDDKFTFVKHCRKIWEEPLRQRQNYSHS